MSPMYNPAVVRQLLMEAFTAEDLPRFCGDRPHLKPVCDRFGPGFGKDDMVDELLKYAHTRGLMDELLAAVKACNPRQYAQFEADLLLPEQKASTIGEYELVEEIGRGGMGVVHRAYQPSLGRYVAIKVLPPELSFNQAFLERFKREARAVAQLSHPNIVAIHSVGEQSGTHYLVMEFLEGRTLKDVIAQSAPLPAERALRIVEQVASALDYAHERGFVHRDVKPANIFVGPPSAGGEERVTLADFGIAKAIAGEAAAAEPDALTRTGTLMGTPEYMSPEQADGQPIDRRTDLYALGVVLYEMLTGRMPFQAPTPLAVLHKIVFEPPPAPRTLNPAITPAVEAVILQAIAKRPDERFQHGAELAQALRAALSAGSTAAVVRRPAATRTVTPPPAGILSRISALLASRHVSPQVLAGGVVGVLVLTAILLIGALAGGPDGPPTPTPPDSTATITLASTDTPAPTGTPTLAPSTTALPPTHTPAPTLTPESPTNTPIATLTPAPPTDTPTSTATPTATRVLPCSVTVDARLAGAWERKLLGCPLAPASITWAAWEPFERGEMLWLDDPNLVYAFVQTRSAPASGPWQMFDEPWDGSYPDGVNMGPPPGLYEPVRGFGALWRNKLGGPAGALGWARDEEKGFCARVQRFDLGFVFVTDDLRDPDNPDDPGQDCAGEFNWARDRTFMLFIAVYDDETWRRY